MRFTVLALVLVGCNSGGLEATTKDPPIEEPRCSWVITEPFAENGADGDCTSWLIATNEGERFSADIRSSSFRWAVGPTAVAPLIQSDHMVFTGAGDCERWPGTIAVRDLDASSWTVDVAATCGTMRLAATFKAKEPKLVDWR